MFVSNGNFYDVSSEVANSLPTDANGVPFEANDANGNSWIVIETVSGTTISM